MPRGRTAGRCREYVCSADSDHFELRIVVTGTTLPTADTTELTILHCPDCGADIVSSYRHVPE